jgi:6,7-dimethyl-8-ribityllumazine synthase
MLKRRMAKVLIIEARFYREFSDLLLAGAQAALKAAGVTFDVITVPGALEIPAALKFAAEGKNKYDAYIALGVVIRGETSHYDIVCNESARGVYDLVLRHGLALGNGILTVENDDQALDRADPARKNKGGEAARAALEMLQLKRHGAGS